MAAYESIMDMWSIMSSRARKASITIEHNERVAAEEKRRRADMRRFNQLTQDNLPAAMMQLNRIDNRTGVTTRRAKLNLPAPMVSEEEISAIL